MGPVRRSSWTVGKALDEAYRAGRSYGDTGAFGHWLEKSGLASRGEFLRGRLQREFERAVEGEPERELSYKGVRVWLRADGEWSTALEPETRFDGLAEAKQFVDAMLRGKNPLDLALRKAGWVLPFDEFVGQVRDKLVRRGLHKAGVPLETMIVEALREQWDTARAAYQEGGPGAVDRALRGKNPLDLATIVGVGILAGAVQGVVEPYVTRHVYGQGSGPVGAMADNPGREYLLQVFGKGYLAGGKAVTPGKMFAPGLVPSYTHDPRKALRVSLDTAEQMQRTHGGQFAAVPVEEALRAGPTSIDSGGPTDNPGNPHPFPILAKVGQQYLARSEKTPGGIADFYTDTPAEAKRLNYWDAREYQERRAAKGLPRAEFLPVATAFERWRKGNPGERFYAAPDDWTLQTGRSWWAVYDTVTGEKMNVKGYGERPVYGSERLAQKAADKLNRDWAAGKIRVIPEGEGGSHAA